MQLSDQCCAKNLFNLQEKCPNMRENGEATCSMCKTAMRIIEKMTNSIRCSNFVNKPRCLNKVYKLGDTCEACLLGVRQLPLFETIEEDEFFIDDEFKITTISSETSDKLSNFAKMLASNSTRIIQRNSPAGIYVGQSKKLLNVRASEHQKVGNFPDGKYYSLGYVKGRNWACLMEEFLINFHLTRVDSPKVANKCTASGGFTSKSSEKDEIVLLYLVTMDTMQAASREVKAIKNETGRDEVNQKKLTISQIAAILACPQFSNHSLNATSLESFRTFNLLWE